MEIDKEIKFAILAESSLYEKELFLHDLSFAQLMDDIVVPFETGAEFFVDGVAVNKDNLKKIKIIRQHSYFQQQFDNLHYHLRAGSGHEKKVSSQDYPIRLQALYREAGDDVTSQIIKAYDIKIKPRLRDYLPNRKELITGAFQVFIEAMKLFAKNNP